MQFVNSSSSEKGPLRWDYSGTYSRLGFHPQGKSISGDIRPNMLGAIIIIMDVAFEVLLTRLPFPPGQSTQALKCLTTTPIKAVLFCNG